MPQCVCVCLFESVYSTFESPVGTCLINHPFRFRMVFCVCLYVVYSEMYVCKNLSSDSLDFFTIDGIVISLYAHIYFHFFCWCNKNCRAAKIKLLECLIFFVEFTSMLNVNKYIIICILSFKYINLPNITRIPI